MPDLTGLPPWAVVIFLAAAGIGFIVIRSGILDGIKKPPGERQNTGEIVALTVDSRSLDRLAGEVAGLTIASTEGTAALRKFTEAVETRGQQTERLTEEIHEMAREVRELAREVSKARP